MKIKKVKKYFQKNWRLILVICLAIVFFIGTSSYNFLTQQEGFVKWGSPDETANYIFSKLYAQEGRLTIQEDYNLYTQDIMHPRSFRSDHGILKPVSFLGIILIYGSIAKVFTYVIIPYLTPFFASIGIVFFYLLIKRIFNGNISLLSAFFLASFPPYIYYSARSMFHNVLLVVLLIIGLYFSVLMTREKKKSNKLFFWKVKDWKETKWLNLLYAGLGGFFMGLAIITRTSELVWILPMLVILWAFNIKKVGVTKLLVFLSFIFLAIIPALYYNNLLYGNAFFGGYGEMNQSIVALAQTSTDLVKTTITGKLSIFGGQFKKISNTIFYFGFHPKFSVRMMIIYFTQMFFWLFWMSLFGLLIFIFKYKKNKYKQWIYLGVMSLVSLILIIYYGSWEFHDNPDPNQFTIGNSYTRYWLPVYIGLIPFACLFIVRLTRVVTSLFKYIKFENKIIKIIMNRNFWRVGLRMLIIAVIYIISIRFVLIGSEEGLIKSAKKTQAARAEQKAILEQTEHNATIITRYHDKLLFPERKVIVGLFNDRDMVRQYANLATYLPVYYYNFSLPQKDIEYLNSRRLAEVGLSIEEIKKITNDFTLYRLNLVTDQAAQLLD